MAHHPLIARFPLDVSSATQARRFRRATQRLLSARRYAYHAFLLGGIGLGLVLALPVVLPEARECPPAGEGLVACQLARGPLRSLTVLVLTMLGAHLLARLALDWLPALYVKRRAGEPLLFSRPGTRAGAADHEQRLLASCWGDVGASRHPDPRAVQAAAAHWRHARSANRPTGIARLEGRITWPNRAPVAAASASGDESTASRARVPSQDARAPVATATTPAEPSRGPGP